MKSNPQKVTPVAIFTVVEMVEASSELERFAAAYVRFDALMTAQLLELEFRFRDYWTPQAKLENLARK